MSFEALLTELDTMAKALPAEGDGDDKIAAAAAAAGADPADGGEGDGTDKEEPIAKSFQVTLADGTVVEAEDGTDLVKALVSRLDVTDDALVKALGTTVTLLKAQDAKLTKLTARISEQDALLKSLGTEGRGRKALLTIVPKAAPLAKAEPEGMTAEQFMVKAEVAFNAGRITGRDLSLAETLINRGEQLPVDIVTKVVSQ